MQTFDQDQHRYKSPKMRARRERMMPEGENPMEHGAMEEKPMEQASGFASADVFKTPPKEGDTLTITITSVDPDTGEVEFKVMDGEKTETPPNEMAPETEPAAEEMA
jgi:hypothetical protein